MRPAFADGTWDVPARFNFSRDVIEATATENPDQRALAFVDRSGVVHRMSFADVAIASAHWANLLRDVGVERGDRVLVLVGKTPDWHGILLGALRLGAIAVPCSEMLRAKDLAFRASHSGAKLVIADRSCEAEAEAMLVGLGRRPLVIYLDDAKFHLHDYPPRAPFADTAADEIVLEQPRVRRLGILLDVARQDRVAAAADRDVERRTRTPRIRQTRREAHAIDEPLRVQRRVDLPGRFALPPLVTVFLGLS